MEGRASPKRHSQSCARHKLLQKLFLTSTQCLVAAENEKKEVRSLLLHAFH